jgi:hypothetical protein
MRDHSQRFTNNKPMHVSELVDSVVSEIKAKVKHNKLNSNQCLTAPPKLLE